MLIAVVMLLATLFYPFGYDQAVFGTAGEMILRGAAPYRDFIDTKPPLIYYLYSAPLAVFGRHEWSIHAFDILWQCITAFCFFRILRRRFSTDHSLLAVSLTMILYAGSGFWMTAEAESFSILPSLLLLDGTLRAIDRPSKSLLHGSLAGIASVILFSLKYTLAIGAIPALAFVIFSYRIEWREKLSFLAGFLASDCFILGGCVIMFARSHVLHPFFQSLDWLSHYASIVPVQHPLAQELLIVFPERIIYSMSVTLFAFATWGIIRWRWGEDTLPKYESMSSLLVLTFLAQLLGILIERKIEFPYQYTRALWAVTPFMASAILFAEKKFLRRENIYRLAVSVALIVLVTLFSPLPRIFTQTISWPAIALSGENTAAEVQRRIPDYFAEEQQQVARYLDSKMASSDRLFFWGNDVGIYFFADRLPRTVCLTATPFRTSFSPPEWKDTLLRQLQSEPPKYFVVEFGDSRPAITESALDSYSALLQWKGLRVWLMGHYGVDTTIGHFRILRLTAPTH